MLLLAKKILVTRYEEKQGTNVYLKPIKIGKFYFYLFTVDQKQRKIHYTKNYRKNIMLIQVNYLQ